MFVLALFVIGLIFAKAANTFIPIDADDYAFNRGTLKSFVNVEFYIDLTCSACLESWPTITKVYETYKDSVHFYYRLFPLPYHQQGFIVNKAAHLVSYYGNENAVWTFFDTAFAQQSQIYNAATYDTTYHQVVDIVANWAVQGTGVTLDQYYYGMNASTPEGNQIEMHTRYEWKYGTIHGTWATPYFYINGLAAGDLDTFEDWQATLDPLIKAAEKRQSKH